MELKEALDIVYGHRDWWNPIAISVTRTPYEAYTALRTEYKGVVRRLIGHEPNKEEG